MKTFILKLDKNLSEELYENCPIEFVGHVLIEALFNIIQGSSPASIADIEYHPDDPDSAFDTSVELLAGVLEKFFPEDVSFIETEESMLESVQVSTAIGEKLTIAINAVNDANDFMTMTLITNTLLSTEFQKSFKFGAKHLPGQVVFTLWSELDDPENIGLKELLSPA